MRDKASGGKNIGISQHEWEIFFKDMPQPAVILDPEHDIIAANNAALKIIGNKEAYVLGKRCFELFHGTNYPPKGCPLETIINTGQAGTIEMEMEAFCGTFLISCTPIYDEAMQLQRIIHVATDITEMNKAKLALQKSEMKYRGIFENAVEGIFLSTPEGRFESVNPAMAKMCGFSSPEEMIAAVTDIRNQLYVIPEERDEYERIMDTYGFVEKFEHQIYRKDGTKIWISTSSQAVKDGNGNITFYEGTNENITERKTFEEELKKSEAMLQGILRASAVGIGLLTNRTFVWVNDYVTTITGYTKDELIGKSARIFYENDDEFTRVGTEKYAEIRETGKGSIETRWKRKNGEIIDIFLSSVAVDAKDLSSGVVFTALDITSEKRAKAALMTSEERFRMLAELLPQTIFEMDTEGNLTYTNRQSLTQFGYTREDFENGLSAFSMVDHKDRIRVIHDFEEVIKGSQLSSREYTALRKDGTTFPIDVHTNPIINHGQVCGVRGIVVDISERKAVEQTLSASEAKYRAIFENTGTATLIVEHDTTILLVNTEFERLSGFSKAEIEGKKSWTEFVHSDDIERHKQINELMKINFDAAPNRYEFLFVDRKGDIKNVFITIGMVPGTNQQVASLIDNTEQKRNEEARKKLESQLLQSQKMEAIGQLAGGIAHDFNNILTTILGYSDLALLKIHNTETLKDYINYILTAARRAVGLTGGLLTFSRRQIVKLKPLNVNDVVDTMRGILARLLTEDIELKTEISDIDLIVMADETQLSQVLINLATNARDSMPNGGKIFIGTRKFVMDDDFVSQNVFGRKGDYVQISFSDTGSGIEKGMIDKIFEPFFTTKEVGKGTGLGLSIVYGIIKEHKGFINVYSEKEKGTTFNIYIPMISTKTETFSKNEEIVLGGNETILVAEDDISVRTLTRTILESKGYTVLEANDGADAIKVFEYNKDRIDMVMLDVVMPNKNGQEANEAIQRIRPGVPVLFISGYTADIVFEKGIGGVEINFISKPLLPDELLRKVRSVIDKAKTTLY